MIFECHVSGNRKTTEPRSWNSFRWVEGAVSQGGSPTHVTIVNYETCRDDVGFQGHNAQSNGTN